MNWSKMELKREKKWVDDRMKEGYCPECTRKYPVKLWDSLTLNMIRQSGRLIDHLFACPHCHKVYWRL
jgi:uncharacterized protein with PIN domain